MGKRNRGFTHQKYERWIKEGRGSGEGKDYKPFITIQDIPSTGRETRLYGYKTLRQHDFISDNERDVYYIYFFADNIIDIREKYPLKPIEETEAIAESISVTHPTDPKTKEHKMLITDFVFTVDVNCEKKLKARSVVPSKRLEDIRVVEKLEIERRYWQARGIDWGIILDKKLTKYYPCE